MRAGQRLPAAGGQTGLRGRRSRDSGLALARAGVGPLHFQDPRHTEAAGARCEGKQERGALSPSNARRETDLQFSLAKEPSQPLFSGVKGQPLEFMVLF